MKKNQAITIIAILAVAAIALGALYFTNNDQKTKDIQSLNESNASQASEIKALSADLEDKSGQIDALNADAAEKAEQIESLTASVEDKSSQIETLTKEVTDKSGQVETLTADIAEKTDQIGKLNAEITEKQNQIDKLNAELAELKANLKSLNEDEAYKSVKIEVLTADAEDKANQIEILNQTIEKKESQLSLANAELEKKTTTLAELNSKVTDLTGQLKDAEGKLTAAEQSAKDAEETAQQKMNEALETAQATADAAKAELEGQVSDLTQKLANANKEKEEALASAKTAADEAMKTAQEAAEAAKIELEGKITDLTEKLTAAEEAANTAATEKAELESKVSDLTKQVEDVTSAAAKSVDEALKTAQENANASKTELETSVTNLTEKLEETETAKKELEEKVQELEARIANETSASGTAENKSETKNSIQFNPGSGLTHEEYVNAEIDSNVCVETYVQATQSWWDNKIVVYAQSPDGAYFIYNMNCSEEDAAKLHPGTKIRVNGYKSEWAGEIEICDGTFEILEEDTYIAVPSDVTNLLGTDNLILHQNEKVLFTGLTVVAQDDGRPVNYRNETNRTDDLYFRVSKDGEIYNFCVEYYLCDQDTEVYKTVENLQLGEVIDIEAYLYWYEGPNPHTIKVAKAGEMVIGSPSVSDSSDPAEPTMNSSEKSTPADILSFDLNELTFDELNTLHEKVNNALWASEEWKEVIVPTGLYQVGKDIPAGTWNVSMTKGYARLELGSELDGSGNSVSYSLNHFGVSIDEDTPSQDIHFQDGMYVEITYNNLKFTSPKGTQFLFN